MAATKGSRSLEETPTWAVAVVCFVLVAVSIVIEYILHLIGKWLKSRNKPALYEALEKIKAELMLMGFISLMLTVGQGPISDICISEAVGATWHPCTKKQEIKAKVDKTSTYGDKCTARGKVPFVTAYGIHQLHIFIFVLAVFHVLYCIITLVLGRVKMRKWKAWEMETRTVDYQFSHDPERFRFARDTSFGRRHLNVWTHSSVLLWFVCFFRQFVRSVPKVDYLTLRHGFIIAHLAPQSQTKFNFQKYINRSLEDDFKVVVGISPTIWLCAILFLLFNTHGTYSYLWLPFLPLIIILLVGTKLQVVITKMALRIQERGEVVKGTLVVQPGDDLFWFSRPRFILYLIHFVLFQNAFQLAFFIWTLYEFGLKSCFHEKLEDVIIRITMGVLIQILCSYVTLPLYALVTQMGSNMKPTIFNERVATALRKWHHSAKKHIKQTRQPGSVTPMTSAPGTPLHAMAAHGMSPVHLLRHYRSEHDSFQASPRTSNMDKEVWESERGISPSQQHDDVPWSKHNRNEGVEEEERDGQEPSSTHALSGGQSSSGHHEIDILPSQPANFSFDKRPSIAQVKRLSLSITLLYSLQLVGTPSQTLICLEEQPSPQREK